MDGGNIIYLARPILMDFWDISTLLLEIVLQRISLYVDLRTKGKVYQWINPGCLEPALMDGETGSRDQFGY